MLTIGVTGGTGAGKTSALRTFDRSGALALDCDAIYHELLAQDDALKAELENAFHGVTGSDGKIDRKKLAATVFKDEKMLQELNRITHKYIGREIERRLASWERHGGAVAVIDAIALIESGRSKSCDIVIGVIAPLEKRLSRIMERDGITRELARQRIDAQKPDGFYRDNCTYILENNYDTAGEFEEECRVLYQWLLTEYGYV